MVPDADPSAETHEISVLDPESEVYAIMVPSGDHEVLVFGVVPEIMAVIPLPSEFMTPICVLYVGAGVAPILISCLIITAIFVPLGDHLGDT